MRKKRSFSLIEVLISLSLVLLTLPPLLTLQKNISQETLKLTREIRIREELYTHFCYLLEQLYENRIPLPTLPGGEEWFEVENKENRFPNLEKTPYFFKSYHGSDHRVFVLMVTYLLNEKEITLYAPAEREKEKE